MKINLYLISSASIGSMGYAIAWKGCTLGRTDIWDEWIIVVKCIGNRKYYGSSSQSWKKKKKSNINYKEKEKRHAYQYSH